MNIEANLQSIADSLKLIADHLTKAQTHEPVPLPVVPAPVAAPAPVEVPAPVATACTWNIPEPVATPEPVVSTACPITTQAELVKYVMESYKTLGPVKGNMIQGVLASVGSVNINGVSPDKYATIYNGIEALKVA
jgi:hypothetical protein